MCRIRLAALLLMGTTSLVGQGLQDRDRALGRGMLQQIRKDIQKEYYDPSFGEIDLDTHFAQANEKLLQAASVGQMLGIIAQALVDFNDSHTRFIPPGRVARTEYGWQMQMIGDECLITAVKPKSEAEARGLKPGDRIAVLDGYQPTRESFKMIRYFYYALRPQPGMRLTTVSPSGQSRQVDVPAKITEGFRVRDLTDEFEFWEYIRDLQNEGRKNRHTYLSLGEDGFIWKMPAFDLADRQVESMMGRAKNREGFILDLRGNSGGYVKTLETLGGYFFTEQPVKIADLTGRKKMKPLMAKPKGGRAFTGKVVVLVDSETGSSAELFARVMQIEERGMVIGDKTSGAVMQSRVHRHSSGVGRVVMYGANITNADVIMSDGGRLERAGVIPDELLIPSQEDLAAGRDPVLARAVNLIGYELSPEQAGEFFPIEWED
ncbi:MAG: S41 family peptidase [Bryobacterales bacterium]|nr:S41 family peptidase [Bryobacterales bacterium]